MLVFRKHRLVFIATPKTGSTAIEAVLGDQADLAVTKAPELKHTPLGRYNRFLAPYFKAALGETFETCALIREPADWLGSWYRYRQREGVMPGRSTRGISFDEFVRAYTAEKQPAFAQVGTQGQMLQTREGERVTHLYRYEDMPRFVAFLQQRLGQTITLPRLNVSPAGETDLSAGARALLRQHLAADYALYDGLDQA